MVANVREVFPQNLNNLIPLAILDILLEFLKSNVNDIVVMKFFGRDFLAELEPDAVEQIDFFVRQPWGVRTQVKNLLLPLGRVDFESQMGSRFG